MNPDASKRLSEEIRALQERITTVSFHPIENGEPVKNKFQCPRCGHVGLIRNMQRNLDGGSTHCTNCGFSFHKCVEGCNFGSPLRCELCQGKGPPLSADGLRVIFSIFVLGALVIAAFGWYLMAEAP